MAEFLPATIESVLAQDFSRLEYLVMDGGSTDGTLDILKRYQGRVRWYSQPDLGPADALNRGFELARGSVLAWLNADDLYLPGAVGVAVRHLLGSPDLDAVYGEGLWIDAQGGSLGPYPTRPFDPDLLSQECYICQPACFFRREAFQAAGGLDTTLQFAFDYDLWIRMARPRRFSLLPECLAASRMHPANKTLGQRKLVFLENFRVLKRHFGYIPFRWIFAYSCYLLDKRDQFNEPLSPSALKYALSLPMGLWQNRRRMPRYLAEWASKMSPQAFARYRRYRASQRR